jgi:energy-coupling factor transporter ATP-binding protein EcfA2
MFENDQICPYTGLRSFTEEESLYFKGREEDIDAATAQLQRNKFLMLTGASGDGKSSLVYAGIIPNARAGFLKAKYTQWCLADFRPERSPFLNLCRSLANQLEIDNEVAVESELRHGFSALVDLYKNSNRYIDQDSSEWMALDDYAKASIKRKAANLIILVDQFEEFFTNPENYNKGVPSEEANLVLNLLLETSRIALEEGLPIYIIFTMRSDYIGQCAAFRGLPEYIGFSQFFVPRLNRAQLQLVIEEPAILSGNRISRRLTERLIHDLTEGVDQLPILQHALNQIWHAAKNGSEEMDLIHYAMVGGMSPAELPNENVEKFNQWFEGLPHEIKACYHEPSLQNVLDTHTNKLFEQAREYYVSKTGKEISSEDVKEIIKNAFICLTKIDQSRAVRNRMTLQEITDILGRPRFGTKEVGEALNIFREPGNTFIRPFILNDTESQIIHENDVLDITHESLIRNWEYLEKWANEEFENYSTSQDFEQQLNRWVESGKSNGFLLPIGPLTYFENWFNTLNPNAYWIARYLPEELDQQKKLSKAKSLLSDSKEFLKRSARKHIVTRTIMYYGPKKIGIAIALVAFLVFSSIVIRQYLRQQNSYIFKSIQTESGHLINSPKVAFENKAILIVEQLKLGLTSIDEVISTIPEPIEKINIATGIASLLVFQGRNEPKDEIFRSLAIADSLSAEHAHPNNPSSSFPAILKELNDLRVTLEMAYFYNPDSQINIWRHENAGRAGKMGLHILQRQPADFNDIQNLTLALEHGVNYKIFTPEESNTLLKILSPFENDSLSDWVKENFDTDNLLERGDLNYGFKSNGLYQQLEYLYASQGNSVRTLDCMDVLLANAQNNYQGDYAAAADNAANIAAVFYRFGQEKALDDFVSGYVQRKNITAEEFYARLLGRMLKSTNTTFNLHLYGFMDSKQNLNLQFSGRDQLSFFFAKYREVVESTVNNQNEKNYLIALSYKNEGILKHLNLEEAGNEELTHNELFDRSLEYYFNVGSSYLMESISVIGASGSDNIIVPRKFLFLYPDIRLGFHPLEPRSFFFFYFSDVFIEYILDKNLIDHFYPSNKELDMFTIWLKDYNSRRWVSVGFLSFPVRYEVFKKLENILSKRENIDQVDLNLLYLYLGEMAYQNQDKEAVLYYYNKINPDNIFNILQSKEYNNQINNHSFRLIATAIEGLSHFGQFENAYRLAVPFKKTINRSSLYAYAAKDLLDKRTNPEMAKKLLDSARVEFNRTGIVTTFQPHRIQLAYANSLYDPKENLEESFRIIKNLPAKIIATQFIIRSLAYYGKLYEAQRNFPDNLSDDNYAILLSEILHGYAKGKGELNGKWEEFQKNYRWQVNRWIFYIDESS